MTNRRGFTADKEGSEIIELEQKRCYEEAGMYMWNHTENEPEVCKQFGCGRRLRLEEKLYGNNCFYHQKVNQ